MKYTPLVAALLLVLTWSILKDLGPDATSGPLVASPSFRQVGDEFVSTTVDRGDATITQPLTLAPNQNYVVEFEAASTREAHIVAGFSAGPGFLPGASFAFDLDQSGRPAKIRHFLHSGAAPKNLQLKIASSGDRILIRRVSVRKRSLPWTLLAWLALLFALVIIAAVTWHLSRKLLHLPRTVSWLWPLVTAISFTCILRNLALPRPFVFGDELIYALLSRFAGREALLNGNGLIPIMPNSLYLHLYQWAFRFDDNFLEAAKLLNVFFFAIALVALYAVVRLFQPASTALLAVAIVGIGPINIYSACFMPESMYFCFFSLLVYFFVRYIYAQPLRGATLGGICLAAVILVKPHGLILIAPWLITIILLKFRMRLDLPWRRMGAMALCFILSVASGVALINFALTGRAAFGLGTAYGPIAASSASSGSVSRIAGLMGAHLAALSSLYALPLLVAGCYLLQRRAESTEKTLRLNALVLLVLTCLVTLIFSTSKFTTLWGPAEPESQRLFVRYYSFLLPWLVASFFCAYPELDWSKRRYRALFLAGGVALGSLALLAVLKLGASHSMTFVDFPDIFWFYTQHTGWRYFVATLTTLTLTVYLVRRPAATLFAASLGLLAIMGSLWTSEFLLAQAPTSGDVAGAVFRPLIRPEALDRGLVLVSNGSDLDAYRLMFHLLGAYDVSVQDATTPVTDATLNDRPWAILAGAWPVQFSYQDSLSWGGYTLYLRPDGESGQYTQTQGIKVEPVEETVKDPHQPFAHIDMLGQTITSVHPVVAANAPLQVSGWAVDPTQRRLAGGVAVVVDQKRYPAVYGQPRPDVADFFKNPALLSCGFSVLIPREAVGKGPHEVVIQVVAPNRKVYWVGGDIGFNAN